MKNFPTDIAKTRIKMDKFPISLLFLCDFEEYFPTLSICGEFGFTPIKWTVQLRIDTLIAQRAHTAGGAVGSPAVVETFYVIE